MVLTFCHNLLNWLSLFDPPLMALAVLVWTGGSYTVFICLDRALTATGRRRGGWLVAICVCFGAQIWAGHFVAMLAYLPALPFSYDILRSFGSICVAVLGCVIPFGGVLLRPEGRFTPAFAGIGLGLMIALTHFIGIGAMNTGAGVSGSAVFDLAGLVFAMVMAGFAIGAARQRSRRYHLALASCCLMLAVFGLYFISMGGFGLRPVLPLHAVSLNHELLFSLVGTESLGLAIASASGVVLIAAVSAAMADRRIGVLQAHEADKLRHQMRHDETTGLPNRLFLKERLGAAVAAQPRLDFAVLILDLDRFKPVNDLCGRETGDRLLRQAADRLRRLIGPPDITARIGGDKFVILHHAAFLPAGAITLAARLIQALEEPFAVDGHTLALSASVGIAVCPQAGAVADILLQDAETALHYARAQGGGQPCLFQAEMRRQQEARRQVEHDFRRAIEARQFTVHYQPLFEAGNLSLCGFEALLRWQHPARGLVSPGEFIPFAEKSGLINSLGLFVLETACRDAALWPDHLRISVNISPVQLRMGDLIGAVGGALQKAELPAHRLELEVTEGALIENREQAHAILSRLKEMGVRIAIDDFGMGYSSLSYLRHFPFDRIKIDRSFIENLDGDSDSLLIVRAIVNLGHSMRVDVVAEGIETAGQLQLLRQQHCNQLQGYLLGRPVPAAEANILVETHVRVAARRFSRQGTEINTLKRHDNPEPVAKAAGGGPG